MQTLTKTIISKRCNEVTKVNSLKINPENNSEEEKPESNVWKQKACRRKKVRNQCGRGMAREHDPEIAGYWGER